MTEHSVVTELLAVATDLARLTRRKHLRAEEAGLKHRLKARVIELAALISLCESDVPSDDRTST